MPEFTPRVPKKILVFTAACVWLFAGCLLLLKAVLLLNSIHYSNFWAILICIMSGILFYVFMFSKISVKHIKRIKNLKVEKPCFFSFFSFKGYLLMAIMIGGGVLLRKSGIVQMPYMALFYIVMGLPLLMSSVRFYYTAFTFDKNISK